MVFITGVFVQLCEISQNKYSIEHLNGCLCKDICIGICLMTVVNVYGHKINTD